MGAILDHRLCYCSCTNTEGERYEYTVYDCIITTLIISTILALPVMYIWIMQNDKSENGVCIWNASDGLYSSFINGLYSSDGRDPYNGHRIYSKREDETCSIDALYLFHSNNEMWSISTESGNADNTKLKGYCYSQKAINLADCDSLWQIPPDNPQKNVTVKITKHCPQISCQQLQLYYDPPLKPEPCVGFFERRAPNLYQKWGNQNLYLYFNPTLFRWVCGDRNSVQCTSLGVLQGYAIKQSWYNADDVLIHENRKMYIPWSNNHTLIMMVKENTDLIPNRVDIQPTNVPTTYPTIDPTAYPTNSPTDSPTYTDSAYDRFVWFSECFVCSFCVFIVIW